MPEQRVIPMFSYEDVARAADWIASAFGFTETGRWSDDKGRVTHVNMELDGGMIMLGYPSPDGCSRRVSDGHGSVSDTGRSSSPARDTGTVRCGFAPHADLLPRPTSWCRTQ